MSFVIIFFSFSEADLRHAEVRRGRELPAPLATVRVGNDQALSTPQQDAWKLSPKFSPGQQPASAPYRWQWSYLKHSVKGFSPVQVPPWPRAQDKTTLEV